MIILPGNMSGRVEYIAKADFKRQILKEREESKTTPCFLTRALENGERS